MKEWQYSPTDVCSVGVPNSEKQNIEAKKLSRRKRITIAWTRLKSSLLLGFSALLFQFCLFLLYHLPDG